MIQPSIMKMAWAKNGAKVIIPETTTTLGRASLSQGFPTETSLPLEDGGIPPRREDFNGALNMLSLFAMFSQAGGMFSWSSEVDYDPPCIIYHNSNLWWCVQANGLSTNIVEPGTNRAYWIPFKEFVSSPLDAYPVGAYYISSVSTSPATLFGGTWVRVQDRMILAAGSRYTAGNTGGNDSSSSYGMASLTVNNLPSHNHSCNTTGSHTHARGNMNITGTFSGTGQYYYNASHTLGGTVTGAFYRINTTNNPSQGAPLATGSDQQRDDYFGFEASRNWTGETASNGSHKHDIGNTGKGTAFNIMPPYIVAYVWRRTA